ncbi:MAG: hypothetical protein ACOX65_13650 [Anaerotruncus rubiinfantis]|jgi:Na+-transporting methylmalonyl-CoA/oxaloacetate decarboxylase beta subunit
MAIGIIGGADGPTQILVSTPLPVLLLLLAAAIVAVCVAAKRR